MPISGGMLLKDAFRNSAGEFRPFRYWMSPCCPYDLIRLEPPVAGRQDIAVALAAEGFNKDAESDREPVAFGVPLQVIGHLIFCRQGAGAVRERHAREAI